MTTQSQVLAGPPGDCCLKGVKHFGNPSGEIITIAGIQTYISKPPPPPAKLEDGSSSEQLEDKKKIILFLADVYGPFFINAQLLQDYYASQGLFTISIHPIAFLYLVFPPQVLPSLGLITFLETQCTYTLKRVLTEMHISPCPCNELKRLFRLGSRKSGKSMVLDIITSNTEKILILTFFLPFI